MIPRPFKIIIFATFGLLALSGCDFDSGRTVRLTVGNRQVAESGARISLSRETSESYYACLMSGAERVVLGWDVAERDPEKWEGKRYKARRFRAKSGDIYLNCEGNDVAVIVEITDVAGKMVSGRFSGRVGVGPGTHSISEGTFRAPVEYWDR